MRLKRKSTLRFVLLLILISIFLYRLGSIHSSSYAYTLSLGNGYGFTIKTSKYYELQPELQESVDVHEAVHLSVGTYQIWKKSQLEVEAYNIQIDDLTAKIKNLVPLIEKSPELRYRYEILSFFRDYLITQRNYYDTVQ